VSDTTADPRRPRCAHHRALPAVTTSEAFGELTVHADAASLVALLTFCRDDEALGCELLADLSGVHWPAGGHEIERQPTTTGWPTFRFSEKEGVVEVLYVLRSIRHGHVLRVAVATDDTAPRLPSVTASTRRRTSTSVRSTTSSASSSTATPT
jgi:NADH:ubiquinone oxidoreductase subunit C